MIMGVVFISYPETNKKGDYDMYHFWVAMALGMMTPLLQAGFILTAKHFTLKNNYKALDFYIDRVFWLSICYIPLLVTQRESLESLTSE